MNAIINSSGRELRVGQVWQSNDPRELRAVRIVRVTMGAVTVVNVLSGNRSMINPDRFTTGQRGWSLLQDTKG